MIKFVSNATKSHGHANTLKNMLKEAEEVFISVAYLKLSGLTHLRRFFKSQTRFKIIAGANFGITEPEALTEILGHMEPDVEDGRIMGYLNNLKSTENFHPKMYLARNGRTGYMLIGSANLTDGGLEQNNECSLYHECDIDDQVWKGAIVHFETCIQPDNAHVLTEPIIEEYRQFHDVQEEAKRQRKKFPKVGLFLHSDIDRLKYYLSMQDPAELEKGFAEKKAHYLEAREVLEHIRTNELPQHEFVTCIEDLVGKTDVKGLWYSNGMFRHKGELFEEQEGFRKLVRVIYESIGNPPAFIFDEAKRVSTEVKGAGPNFIGEMMMTYAPDWLANINQNPITVLREEVKADIKRYSSSYKGQDYEDYNSLIKRLGTELGLDSMLKMDYFFNIIYQKIKEKRKAETSPVKK